MQPAGGVSEMQSQGRLPAEKAPPRLERAAHEFEAQMMKELMKPLSDGGALPGGDEDSGSGGALGAFASEALARAVSERGGLGIANAIVHQLAPSGHQNAGTPVTVPRYGNTV